jgi:hypothetical protein
MEDLYWRVRMGMSKDEAIAALRSGEHDYIECIYVSGTTRDGRRFSTPFSCFSLFSLSVELRSSAAFSVKCLDRIYSSGRDRLGVNISSRVKSLTV